MLLHLLTTLALAISPAAVPNPQVDHRGWVSDVVDIIDPQTERALEASLTGLYSDLGVQVAVVTVDDVDSTPKEFAGELFERWQIGDREANNGLLVLMVVDQRRLEMETGYGLEPILTDSWLGSMQKSVMVPKFKQEAYGEGLVLGLAEVEAELRANPEEARLGTRGQTAVQRLRTGEPKTTSAAILAIVGVMSVLGGVVFFAVMRRRRQQRTCPECQVYMPKLGEVEDDAHLTDTQTLEEAIASVNYDVHACPKCDHTRTFRYAKWFSGYSDCPSCAARTRTTQRSTLKAATQYSTGLVRVDESCVNCDYTNSYTRTTPRISSSSSSGGGGGGGSFGGGSSGGGGAGSSW